MVDKDIAFIGRCIDAENGYSHFMLLFLTVNPIEILLPTADNQYHIKSYLIKL